MCVIDKLRIDLRRCLMNRHEQIQDAMRWLERARCALMRCEESGHDGQAKALAESLRAAISERQAALCEHFRSVIRRREQAIT
jgi:hypothetical protein